MKYLKSFNESGKDQIEEIKQTIKDILIPISDKGYEIVVITERLIPGDFFFPDAFNGSEIIIKVVDFKDEPLKFNDEVKEEFIRMVDYLESEGFNSIKSIYVGTPCGSGRVDFSKFISIDSGSFMSLVFVAEFN
jgi:hypothetical protein